MKKKCIFILLVVMLLLNGCNKQQATDNARIKPTNEPRVEITDYYTDIIISESEKIVYNIYAQKLGIYNMENNTWNSIHSNDNDFAYKINGTNNLFTVGNSHYNYFSVMTKEDSGLHKKLDINNKDSAMPIGYYKGEYYFLYNVDDLKETIIRKIVKWNPSNNKFDDVIDLKNQLVANAVIVKDKIYYAAYQTNTDLYILYEYNISSGNTLLVQNELPTDNLYNLDEMLIWNDAENNICNKEKVLYSLSNCESVIDYNSEYMLFFQIYADKSKSLICDLFNAKTGKKISTVDNFIGYDVEDNKLLLLCTDKIEKININDLQ